MRNFLIMRTRSVKVASGPRNQMDQGTTLLRGPLIRFDQVVGPRMNWVAGVPSAVPPARWCRDRAWTLGNRSICPLLALGGNGAALRLRARSPSICGAPWRRRPGVARQFSVGLRIMCGPPDNAPAQPHGAEPNRTLMILSCDAGLSRCRDLPRDRPPRCLQLRRLHRLRKYRRRCRPRREGSRPQI